MLELKSSTVKVQFVNVRPASARRPRDRGMASSSETSLVFLPQSRLPSLHIRVNPWLQHAQPAKLDTVARAHASRQSHIRAIRPREIAFIAYRGGSPLDQTRNQPVTRREGEAASTSRGGRRRVSAQVPQNPGSSNWDRSTRWLFLQFHPLKCLFSSMV